MTITLLEINWFLAGFAFGAVTIWGFTVIIRLHFADREREYEKDKGIETKEEIRIIEAEFQIISPEREIREIKGFPSCKSIVQDCG